jgi:hypothetical protein
MKLPNVVHQTRQLSQRPAITEDLQNEFKNWNLTISDSEVNILK